MADQWTITWVVTAFPPVGGRKFPPARKQKTFDNQREAVYFAMGLTVGEQRTAELHMSGGGEPAYFASIEAMFASYQKGAP